MQNNSILNDKRSGSMLQNVLILHQDLVVPVGVIALHKQHWEQQQVNNNWLPRSLQAKHKMMWNLYHAFCDATVHKLSS
jgi:hypothetical protein